MLYYHMGEYKYFKMICPKCKKEIDDNSIKCPECGARVGRICPNCKTHNVISAMKCKNCNYVLLKSCPNCGATNTAKAKTCRRCGAELDVKKKVAPQQTQSQTVSNTQDSPRAIIESMPKYEAIYSTQQVAQQKL